MSRKNSNDRRRTKRARKQNLRKQKAKLLRRLNSAPKSERMALASRSPLLTCTVNEDWTHTGLVTVTLSRDTPSGITVVGFLVDLQCKGVKDIACHEGLSQDALDNFLDHTSAATGTAVDCAPELAATIVRDGAAYGVANGFSPPPDFVWAREFLGTIGRSDEPIPLGRDGKPLYVAGPFDDAADDITTLRRTLGPDGFHFVAPMGVGDDVDEEFVAGFDALPMTQAQP